VDDRHAPAFPAVDTRGIGRPPSEFLTYKREETIMSVLKWSDPSPPQTPASSSQAPGLVPASTLGDGGECPIAPEEALNQIHLNRSGADASLACTRDAGPGSVREFSLFENGAGI
jgi:hypothetical protein